MVNFSVVNIKNENIDGKEMFYMADDEGNCVFNHENILYGYSVKDILSRYQRLSKEYLDPVHRMNLDIR